MGPRGARVRCPQCKRPFVVLREESIAATAPPSPPLVAQPAEIPPSADGDSDPARVAYELLDSLARDLGGALEEARAHGRVLAEFGPAVMKAFDQYRQRLGERAAPATFRTALKESWGVDLLG